jgi:homoserine kinase
VLALAAGLEGHPDNVAACLLGGLTVAWADDAGQARAVRVDPAPDLCPVVFVPAATASTARARKLLPDAVAHADAARNAGRAALLLHALTAPGADRGLLLAATEDRLHQQYRAPAMPRSAALVDALRADGVAAVVSGAGPSVLAFAPTGSDLSGYASRGWTIEPVAVDRAGASVLPLAG